MRWAEHVAGMRTNRNGPDYCRCGSVPQADSCGHGNEQSGS